MMNYVVTNLVSLNFVNTAQTVSLSHALFSSHPLPKLFQGRHQRMVFVNYSFSSICFSYGARKLSIHVICGLISSQDRAKSLLQHMHAAVGRQCTSFLPYPFLILSRNPHGLDSSEIFFASINEATVVLRAAHCHGILPSLWGKKGHGAKAGQSYFEK